MLSQVPLGHLLVLGLMLLGQLLVLGLVLLELVTEFLKMTIHQFPVLSKMALCDSRHWTLSRCVAASVPVAGPVLVGKVNCIENMANVGSTDSFVGDFWLVVVVDGRRVRAWPKQ
ncbi:hypothetical protein RHRU231_680029 [Rhodococcus ruber]|uniref:Uncharacterized protein n=1 Tax=Rhodococcus ruber TaxID=1830 RepID=A0A098BPV3_9NOCA|nr:hypothetical protein RHRU231_680029 [Rhodococcus ruber]